MGPPVSIVVASHAPIIVASGGHVVPPLPIIVSSGGHMGPPLLAEQSILLKGQEVIKEQRSYTLGHPHRPREVLADGTFIDRQLLY